MATLVRVLAVSGLPRSSDLPWLAAYVLSAALRVPFAAVDRVVLSLRGQAAPPADTVFIVGHWRSGTTHLYNLLAQAPRFVTVSPIATGLPGELLTLGTALRPLLERILPKDRWIDAVEVGPEAPQEDEFALAALSDVSFYHAIFFPCAFDRHFLPSLFADGAREARLERALALFYRKLVVGAAGRRLVVKNPAHSGRLTRLRTLCPGARFVHCVRDPLEVVVSSCRFYERLLAELALQEPPDRDIEGLAIDTYDKLMQRYQAEATALAPPKPVDVRFERLRAAPLVVLEELYDALELKGFADDRPRFASHLGRVADYRQNTYRVAPATRRRVAEGLGLFFDRFGYARPS